MTVVTENGLEWYRDISLSSGNTIDEVKIGSGTNTGSTSETSLGTVEFSATKSSTNVQIEEGTNTNEYVCNITVTGGLEIPAGTDITEFGVFSSDGVLIAIDNFTPVNVSSGVTEAFSMTFSIER